MTTEHGDHTTRVARSAVRGVALLAVRQVLAQALNVLGYVRLARVLAPAELGVFAIVLFAFGVLTALGGAGLQASLVRAADEPSDTDYRAVFAVQELIIALVVVAAWLAAPVLAQLYSRPPGEATLFRLAAVALAITSFQAIPNAHLERGLAFGMVATVEVSQTLVYNLVAVALVYAGFGTLSVGLALVARSLTGAVVASILRPWDARPQWDRASIGEHLAIALPLQGTALVTQLRDGLTPIFIGVTAGAAAVGYVQWATTVVAAPLWATMVAQRVYLPVFARVQQDRAALGRFVEQALRATHALVAPGAVLILALVEPITRLVFGAQWLPAIPIFLLLWPTTLFVPTTLAVLALLTAVGDTRTGFAFATAWAVVMWAVGIPLVLAFGPVGYGLASLAVQATSVALFRRAQARVPFRIAGPIALPWSWAATIGVATYVAAALWPVTTIVGLVGYGLAALAVYVAGVVVIAPGDVRQLAAWLRGSA